MHEEVGSFLRDARSRKWKNIPHDFLETVEKGHGRIETRRYWITEKVGWFADRSEWEGLRSMGMVESIRQIGETITTPTRFYLASIPADAREFARAVRGHWAVENNLHWVLDVCFREDPCRARMGHAAQNLAILRQIALNAIKRDASRPKQGIRPRQKIAGWDNSCLEILIENLDA